MGTSTLTETNPPHIDLQLAVDGWKRVRQAGSDAVYRLPMSRLASDGSMELPAVARAIAGIRE